MEAAAGGHADAMQALLDAGADRYAEVSWKIIHCYLLETSPVIL